MSTVTETAMLEKAAALLTYRESFPGDLARECDGGPGCTHSPEICAFTAQLAAWAADRPAARRRWWSVQDLHGRVLHGPEQ